MSNEISGVSEGNPIGYEPNFEDIESRNGGRPLYGISGENTIQPWQPSPMNPYNPRGGPTYADGKSHKSFAVTMILLLFPLFCLLGVHDLYAGNTGKFVIKILLCIFTIGTLPFLWAIFDFFALCNGTYKDGYGKCI